MLTQLANKYLLKSKPISYGKIASQSMCTRTHGICYAEMPDFSNLFTNIALTAQGALNEDIL